jgi:hypothetical protein
MIVLTCSAGTTADIRRIVTALDASDKAIALFDSRLDLDPGSSKPYRGYYTNSTSE